MSEQWETRFSPATSEEALRGYREHASIAADIGWPDLLRQLERSGHAVMYVHARRLELAQKKMTSADWERDQDYVAILNALVFWQSHLALAAHARFPDQAARLKITKMEGI
jgi:hypothetical protein